MRKNLSFFKNKFLKAFIFGALCDLAFAPLHFFLAAPLSLTLFYLLLQSQFNSQSSNNKKNFFWIGWFYGFGYFFAGVYWIAISLLVDGEKFAWLIPFSLTLIPGVLAFYFGLLCLIYYAAIAKFSLTKNYEKIITFAVCWLICELLRSFLFTGFPWNLLGYVWVFSDEFIQLGSVFGILGLSFFAVLISLLPALFFQDQSFSAKLSSGNKIFAAALILSVIASFIFGYCRIDKSKIVKDENHKLRLVQGNIKQELKWDRDQKYQNFLKHIDLTNSKDLTNIAAVIWSETSVPYVIDSELVDKIKPAIPQGGILVTGGLRLERDQTGEVSKVWNSVFALGNEGMIDHYDKHHLVPFGEYVPWQKYLPFIDKITDGAIGFSQGEGPKTINTQVFSFSPLLCYEVIFSDKIIDKKNRPDLLINLTNDAWFGNSSGPYQHFDMAKMRATEYGISLARVANSGITVFFDPFGRVIKRINLNQEGVIDVEFIKNLEPTFYSRYGYGTTFLLVLCLSFIIFLAHRKNVVRQNYTS